MISGVEEDKAAGTVPTALLLHCPDTENPDLDDKG